MDVARVRLGRARRRLRHRVVDHAAEEEPRHRRARPRQGRPAHRQPHRAARDAQGPAVRLQPRPAGGQGAGLRLGRHPARSLLPAVTGHGRDADASTPSVDGRRAPQGFALATDVAEWLVRAGRRRSAQAHEIAGACVRAARSAASTCRPARTTELAGDRPHLTPEVRLGAHRRRAPRRARRPTAARRRRASPSSSPQLRELVTADDGLGVVPAVTELPDGLPRSFFDRPVPRGRAATCWARWSLDADRRGGRPADRGRGVRRRGATRRRTRYRGRHPATP